MAEASRFNEVKEAEQRRADSVKPLLAYLIEASSRTLEERLQKLAFYAELIYHRENGERLTDAEWRPYMYGMFSHDARRALEQIREDGAEVRHTMNDGKRVIAYISPAEAPELSEGVEAFLDGVVEETGDVTTEELVSWAKGTRLFQTTDFDTPAQFASISESGGKRE